MEKWCRVHAMKSSAEKEMLLLLPAAAHVPNGGAGGHLLTTLQYITSIFQKISSNLISCLNSILFVTFKTFSYSIDPISNLL